MADTVMLEGVLLRMLLETEIIKNFNKKCVANI